VSRAARATTAFVPASLFAAATLVGAVAVGAEPPAAATEERTVCEWVVEPRYIGSGPPKLEPQRVCRTEPVHRPAPPAPPADLRPAPGGTGIVVESEPAKP
jgi:hypothetical protein